MRKRKMFGFSEIETKCIFSLTVSLDIVVVVIWDGGLRMAH